MAFSLIAAACGDSEGGGEETTTTAAETTTTVAETTTTVAETTTTEALPPLVVWADEKRGAALETVTPAFTEATGVDVEIVLVDFGSIKDEVITKGPAGEGPDIFIGAHDWVGELATNGAVAPIDLGDLPGTGCPFQHQHGPQRPQVGRPAVRPSVRDRGCGAVLQR